MKKVLAISTLLLVPSFVFAAGFAKQSLFLSQSTVIEGDTVLIHAVVSDDTTTAFTGKLMLADTAGTIGTVPVSLAAGEANTLSVSWKPRAGGQTVTATLEDSAGNTVETESATFDISPPPQPAQTDAQTVTPVDSSASLDQALANVSPGAAQAVAPALSAIDAGRTAAANELDQGITYAKAQVGATTTQGKVLGAETQKPLVQGGFGGNAWAVLMTVLLYVLTILRFIVGNVGVFYPVVAIVFLYILWRFFRRYRRPRY